MSNYKKNVRPINRAKNQFVKWLKDNNADNICNEKPEVSNECDYYCCVSGFVNNNLYMVYFEVWRGEINIDYRGGEYKYNELSVYDFLQLIE